MAHGAPDPCRRFHVLRDIGWFKGWGKRLLDSRGDIVMPGMSGYELGRKIKDDPAHGTIPVMLLTSLTDPLDIVQGLEAGADNFLTWQDKRLPSGTAPSQRLTVAISASPAPS